MNYSKLFTKGTPQTLPIAGEKHKMEQNNAKGYSYKIGTAQQLKRFLILGTEGGTYYCSEQELTVKNSTNVINMIKSGSGKDVIDMSIDVSTNGLARKNEPAIFSLALVSTFGSIEDKKYMVEKDAIRKVCRTGTHIFTFADYVKNLRGWGTFIKKQITKWYDRTPETLAFLMLKYQSRNGWSHRDMLRLNHIKPTNDVQDVLFNYFVKKEISKEKDGITKSIFDFEELRILEGFEKAKKVSNIKELITLVKDYKLSREMIPTEYLNDPSVQEELLYNMGLTAIIRNLGGFTASGFLNDLNFTAIEYISKQLSDREIIKKSRVHPLQILDALFTYSSGHGLKGNLSWNPVKKIVSLLDKAFYLSFKNVEPTGKNIYLALDVSGSMTCGNIAGSRLTPRQASAAMALVTANVEKNYVIRGFSDKMVDVKISPTMSLNEVIKVIDSISMGGTDCALPMMDAMNSNCKTIDSFIVYTDNETWFGSLHPSEAVRKYRKFSNLDSKLIVVGMTATQFSIADPDDKGMLDVVGFSADAPATISEFMAGRL